MKANRKFVEEKEAVSAVIGVILMVAITVAIAATVYVYVSGMLGPNESEKENASVAVAVADDDTITVNLAGKGEKYASGGEDGYSTGDFEIRVDGDLVTGTFSTWTIGEKFFIDVGPALATATVTGWTSGTSHDVVVTVMDTVIADTDVTIP